VVDKAGQLDARKITLQEDVSWMAGPRVSQAAAEVHSSRRPLGTAVAHRAARKAASFHVPGHKVTICRLFLSYCCSDGLCAPPGDSPAILSTMWTRRCNSYVHIYIHSLAAVLKYKLPRHAALHRFVLTMQGATSRAKGLEDVFRLGLDADVTELPGANSVSILLTLRHDVPSSPHLHTHAVGCLL
jgi:hypothetical protein